MAVPLYRQSWDYSCGPASLLMVMRSLDAGITLDRDLEGAIWKEANLGISRGTSSFGLALSATRRGFDVEVWTDGDDIAFIRRLVDLFDGESVKTMKEGFRRKRKEALKIGVREVKRTSTIGDLSGEIGKELHPIVLVSTGLTGDEDPLPHWVVVTDTADERITINNPESGSSETYPREVFGTHLGFDGQTRTILIRREHPRT